MANHPNEIIDGRTREQWLDRFAAHFKQMRCSLWSQSYPNAAPDEQRANAEFVVDLIAKALGYEAPEDDEMAEYLGNERQVVLTISWQESEVTDEEVVDEISNALDNLMDRLSDDDIADVTMGGTIVRADAKWPLSNPPLSNPEAEGDAPEHAG